MILLPALWFALHGRVSRLLGCTCDVNRERCLQMCRKDRRQSESGTRCLFKAACLTRTCESVACFSHACFRTKPKHDNTLSRCKAGVTLLGCCQRLTVHGLCFTSGGKAAYFTISTPPLPANPSDSSYDNKFTAACVDHCSFNLLFMEKRRCTAPPSQAS